MHFHTSGKYKHFGLCANGNIRPEVRQQNHFALSPKYGIIFQRKWPKRVEKR
jgi:hypothetical protein